MECKNKGAGKWVNLSHLVPRGFSDEVDSAKDCLTSLPRTGISRRSQPCTLPSQTTADYRARMPDHAVSHGISARPTANRGGGGLEATLVPPWVLDMDDKPAHCEAQQQECLDQQVARWHRARTHDQRVCVDCVEPHAPTPRHARVTTSHSPRGKVDESGRGHFSCITRDDR